jgi:hypothetical protein
VLDLAALDLDAGLAEETGDVADQPRPLATDTSNSSDECL